jgi:hypothetical protein
MILAIRTYRRPSIEIPWFFNIINQSEFKLRCKEVYTQRLVLEMSNYDDPLVAKFLTVWDTVETHTEYRNDEVLWKFWTLRDQYNEEHGIVVESASVTEITDTAEAVF